MLFCVGFSCVKSEEERPLVVLFPSSPSFSVFLARHQCSKEQRAIAQVQKPEAHRSNESRQSGQDGNDQEDPYKVDSNGERHYAKEKIENDQHDKTCELEAVEMLADQGQDAQKANGGEVAPKVEVKLFLMAHVSPLSQSSGARKELAREWKHNHRTTNGNKGVAVPPTRWRR